MLRVVFLAHSGFLVELDHVCLLFDWWKGELPTLPEKPLLVFASHVHADHFDPHIFILGQRTNVQFLLGSDFRLTPKNLEKWQANESTAALCRRCGKQDRFSPLEGVTVETVPSTDQGVAFLVTADGHTIFHAGDLNWWHWEGETDAYNHNMAANFKRYVEPLRGRRIDLAMLPLDSRLGTAGFMGPKYFLELAEIQHFLPMHQWDNYRFTEEFLHLYPQFSSCTTPISRADQVFYFS